MIPRNPNREIEGSVTGVDKYAEEGKRVKQGPARTPRPCCLACTKPLRRAKAYRAKETGREWGDYADDAFCGLVCGYRYAVSIVRARRKVPS